MLDVFKKIQDPRLTGLIVWVPMVPGDDALAAENLVSTDKRLTVQAWDGSRKLGDTFAKTLHLKCTAWDVYLVYKPGALWNEELPPEPTFWMHQLSKEADPKLHLQPEKLLAEIQSLLNEVPAVTKADLQLQEQSSPQGTSTTSYSTQVTSTSSSSTQFTSTSNTFAPSARQSR